MNARPFDVKKSRNANYKLLQGAVKCFVAGKGADSEGTSGNIAYEIDKDNWEKSLACLVSAPYLLARLCALFPGLEIEVCGQQAYKVTWSVVLVHPETGHRLTFYDYKGCSSFGSDISGKATPKAFLRDVKALLKILKDDRCPHPYDGCVVGEVA